MAFLVLKCDEQLEDRKKFQALHNKFTGEKSKTEKFDKKINNK